MFPGMCADLLLAQNGLRPLAVSYLQGGKATAISSNINFGAVNFGDEDPDRRIIIGWLTADASINTDRINGVTIGGITASRYASDVDIPFGSDKARIGFAIADLPAGTGGTVGFTTLGIPLDLLEWHAFRVVGTLVSPIPVMSTLVTGGFSSTRNASVTAQEGGVVIGLSGARSTTTTMTWSGALTEGGRQANTAPDAVFEAASAAFATGQSVSSTITLGTAREGALLLAAWR